MRVVKKKKKKKREREEEIKVIPTLSLWKCKTCKTPSWKIALGKLCGERISTFIH